MFKIDEQMRTVKESKDGPVIIANFSAVITKETRYIDGNSSSTILTVVGAAHEKVFREIEVNAEKFASMNWVLPEWGVTAVISPGSGSKEDMRAAIQLASEPTEETIYTHTGWTGSGAQVKFLHAGGAIGRNGNDQKQRVLLPPELKRFNIKVSTEPAKDLAATLSMAKIAKPEIMWPIMGAMLSPILGPVDFAVHIAGRTGTFKSEIAALAQSHFGDMDARNLPGSWSSTANALEAQTFKAKNCMFCVDDFIPAGTSWQVRAYQKTADQLIRGQGNQAGRARLTDVSSLQTTMYPRGGILSTGEDTPTGHSIRARMLIIELTPGDVNTKALSGSQRVRGRFSGTIGKYIQHIAGDLPAALENVREKSRILRDGILDVGHARTPSTIARMITSIHHFLDYAKATGLMNAERAEEMKSEAGSAIMAVGERQDHYLQESDPCDAFCESIRHMLAAHIAHLRTKDGGIPADPETLGWTREESRGDLPTYQSHGKCIGWCDWNKDSLWIDTTAAYADIRKHSGGQITFSKQTMFKRLKDAGLLLRVDDGRQRNTIRVTCENHPRQVLDMPLAQVLEVTERPNGEA